MAGPGLTKNNSEGFSLLEALVALAILIVGFGGLAAAFQSQISNSVSSRNQAMAAIVANSVLTELTNTNPNDWDTNTLADFYQYDYEGVRVGKDGSSPYYKAEISATKDTGWWNVSIGVTWRGWKTEQEKTGFSNRSEDFAYVLDASVSSLYGNSLE